jgi:hypothetical protein
MYAAPTLEELTPYAVYRFYQDLCKVAHEHGIYIPPYEQHCPQRPFATIVCADDDQADLPPFYASDVTTWQTIIHNLLKKDKVIPPNHPSYQEIKYDTNGFAALVTLIAPYHPAYTENNVLLMPHPLQGKKSLEIHHRQAEFYYRIQYAYMGTVHDWKNGIHLIRFINSCNNSDFLRTMFEQQRYVKACQYKFTRERIVSTLREWLSGPQFQLLGGRQRAATTPAAAPVTNPHAVSNSRYKFTRGYKGGSGATKKSGDQGNSARSPKSGDKQVRQLKDLLDDDQTIDDDSSDDDTADTLTVREVLMVNALTNGCLVCSGQHDPYCCPVLKGGVDEQKKVFANLSARRKSVPVRQVTTDATGKDMMTFAPDSDFPQGEQ